MRSLVLLTFLIQLSQYCAAQTYTGYPALLVAWEAGIREYEVFLRSGRRAKVRLDDVRTSEAVRQKALSAFSQSFPDTCPAVPGVDFLDFDYPNEKSLYIFNFGAPMVHPELEDDLFRDGGFGKVIERAVDPIETVYYRGRPNCAPPADESASTSFNILYDSNRFGLENFLRFFPPILQPDPDTESVLVNGPFFLTNSEEEQTPIPGDSSDFLTVSMYGWASLTKVVAYDQVGNEMPISASADGGQKNLTPAHMLPARSNYQVENSFGGVIDDCGMTGFDSDPRDDSGSGGWFGRIDTTGPYPVSKVVFYTKSKRCYNTNADRYSPQFFINYAMVAQVESSGNVDNAYSGHFEEDGVIQVSPELKYEFDLEAFEISNNFPNVSVTLKEVRLVNPNNNNEDATHAQLLWPEQSGGVQPKQYAIDGIYGNGECGRRLSGTTCSKSGPGLSFNYWKATILSVAGFAPDSVKVYYPTGHTFEQPDTLTWRRQTVLLEPGNELANYNLEENSFTVSLKACPCEEPSSLFGCGNVGVPRCELAARDSKYCKSGPIQEAFEEYKQLALDFIDNNNIKEDDKAQLFGSIGCAIEVLDVATQNETLSQLLPPLLQLEGVMATSLVQSSFTGPLSVVYNVLSNALQRNLNPALLYGNAPRVPLYSMERLLSIPSTTPQNPWSFATESPWEAKILELDLAVNQATVDEKECDQLFEGLTRNSAIEESVLHTDSQEVFKTMTSLAQRVGNTVEQVEKSAVEATKVFNLLQAEIVSMRKLIAEYVEASSFTLLGALTDAFKWAVNAIAEAGAKVVAKVAAGIILLVEGGEVTFDKFGSYGKEIYDKLDGDADKVYDHFEKLAESLNGGFLPFLDDIIWQDQVGLTTIDREYLKRIEEVLEVTDRDVEFDLASINDNAVGFQTLARAMINEISTISRGIAATLLSYPPSRSAGDRIDIPTSELSPLMWDVLYQRMIKSLESLEICDAPDIGRRRQLHEDRSLNKKVDKVSESHKMKLRSTASLHSSQASMKRSLQSKGAEEKAAAQRQRNRMTSRCNEFKASFRIMTIIGKSIQTDLVSLADLLREYRTSQSVLSTMRWNTEYWNDQKLICRLGSESIKSSLAAQREMAKLMIREDVAQTREQLIVVCETIQYVLNPTKPACSPLDINKLNTIPEMHREFQRLKNNFRSDWEAQVKFVNENVELIDVTSFVDMEAVQRMNSTSTFSFTLTPDLFDASHESGLFCQHDVEVTEVAVVFVGTPEESQKYSTLVQIDGPFYKVNQDGLKVGFIPAKPYQMGFSYQLNGDDSCDSASQELTRVCGRQICDRAVGTSLELKPSGNFALPSLFATYHVKLTEWGESKLSQVNKVVLLYKGRWKSRNDVSCTPLAKECPWNPAGDLGLAIGLGVGATALLGAVGTKLWLSRRQVDQKDVEIAAIIADDWNEADKAEPRAREPSI